MHIILFFLFAFIDSLSVRDRIHKMRQEGGEKWLSMLSTEKNSPRTVSP